MRSATDRSDLPRCPRCDYEGIVRNGSIASARGRVQRYLCMRCGKKFHPSLKALPVGLREGYLDIEASQLTASFGHVISWALKKRGEDTVLHDVLRRRSLAEEKRILKSLLKSLNEFNLIYTYYGSRFDVPFVRTRCLYHNLDFPLYMDVFHQDLYFLVRSRLNLHSKRLAAVAEFLGIHGKTRVDPAIWVAASFGGKKAKEALDYILEHNIADVRVLEKVHERIELFGRGIRQSI